MANWERKSAYLLREIVKFQTYIDCLQTAQGQKDKIYAERPKTSEKPESIAAAATLSTEASSKGADTKSTDTTSATTVEV